MIMSTKYKEQGLNACMAASVNWKKFRRDYKKEKIWELDIPQICDNLILLLNDKGNDGIAAQLGKPKERLGTASNLTLGILRVYQQQVKDTYDEVCDSLCRLPKLSVSKKDWSQKSELKSKSKQNKCYKLELDETIDISKILDVSADISFEWKSEEWSVNGVSFEAMTEEDIAEFQRIQESPSPQSLQRLRVCSTPIENVSFHLSGNELSLGSRAYSFKTPSPGLKMISSHKMSPEIEALSFLEFSSNFKSQSSFNPSLRKYFKTRRIIQRVSVKGIFDKLRIKNNLFRTTSIRTNSNKLQNLFERVISNSNYENTASKTKVSIDSGILRNFTGSVFNGSDDSNSLSGIFEVVRTPYGESLTNMSNNLDSWLGIELESLRSMITVPEISLRDRDPIFSRSIRMHTPTPHSIKAASHVNDLDKNTTVLRPSSESLRSPILCRNAENAPPNRNNVSDYTENEKDKAESSFVVPELSFAPASLPRAGNTIVALLEKPLSSHQSDRMNSTSYAVEKGAGDFLEESISYFVENLSYEKQIDDDISRRTQSTTVFSSPHRENASMCFQEHGTKTPRLENINDQDERNLSRTNAKKRRISPDNSPYHNRGDIWSSPIPITSLVDPSMSLAKKNAEGKRMENEVNTEIMNIEQQIWPQVDLTQVDDMQIVVGENDKFDTLFEGTTLSCATRNNVDDFVGFSSTCKEVKQQKQSFPLRSYENLLDFGSWTQGIMPRVQSGILGNRERSHVLSPKSPTVKKTGDAAKRCYPYQLPDNTNNNKVSEDEHDQISNLTQTVFPIERFGFSVASSTNAEIQTLTKNQVENSLRRIDTTSRIQTPCRTKDQKVVRPNIDKRLRTTSVSKNLLPTSCVSKDPTPTPCLSKNPSPTSCVSKDPTPTPCNKNYEDRQLNESEKRKNSSREKSKPKKAIKKTPRKKRKIARKESSSYSEDLCNSPFNGEYNGNINEPSFRADWDAKAVLKKLWCFWQNGVYPINMIILTREANFRVEAAIAFHSVLVLSATQSIVLHKCGTKLEIYHIAKGDISEAMIETSSLLEKLDYII